MTETKVSGQDLVKLAMIRSNVSSFLRSCGETFVVGSGERLLDVAPQDHEGAAPYFPTARISTFDIDPESGCDYIGDICKKNVNIADGYFSYVVCTEVLEHVRRPFEAVDEIERILKPAGLVFVTTPFNFRIHGPLPDCWRFTEYGLRELFSNFEILQLSPLEDIDRFLMPIQYTLVARKRA